MKEGTEYFAGRMADLQADNASSRPHHAQHFSEALSNIGQVAYGEGGAAAINTVIRQVNRFSITDAQLNLVL